MKAWVEVSRSAVERNVRAIRSVVGPVAVLAAVKANAYGHGLVDFSRTVLESGAEWLGVVNAYEASILRAAGVRAPVLTFFEPEPDEIEWLVENDVSFTCFSERLLDALRRRGGGARPARIHIKVNTGMNRQGLPPERAIELVEKALRTKGVFVEGVYSHLATAEQPEDPFALEQIAAFRAVRDALSGFDIPYFHLANSGGALYYPDARLDMVRPGIALYGYLPAPDSPPVVQLEPALSLRCRVSAVNELLPGEGVSYGLRWKAPSRTRVAVCPVGYGDGILRSLEGRFSVFVGEKRFPQVGTICMDQFAVVAGDEAVEPGTEAAVICRDQTAEDLATRVGTISYEILARLSERVPRVYVD